MNFLGNIPIVLKRIINKIKYEIANLIKSAYRKLSLKINVRVNNLKSILKRNIKFLIRCSFYHEGNV